MRICLILEGCYPYVTGGVSSWAHQLIQAFPEHEFVLWTVGASSEDRGKFKYELPANVVEVHEVFLSDALALSEAPAKTQFGPEEIEALSQFTHCANPDWNTLFRMFHDQHLEPLSFLMSEEFLSIMTEICRKDYPYTAFADMFHTLRSMLLPVFYIMCQDVPKADMYHTIATGYSGIMACVGSYVHHAPIMLSEHGIYTREREEEIIRAAWVPSAFKRLWVQFFNMLSRAVYDRSVIITSLFENAQRIQIDLGADPAKCRVTPNGVKYERFCDLPRKEFDGWANIGAVLRIAPIKDVKTLIYAFAELKYRVKQSRLYIMGPEDDQEYAQECYDLVKQLQVEDVIFTGTVDVTQYLPQMDFTVLSSISEGQPLSVLESFAAGVPAVTTDVGCCRDLIEGGTGDTLGAAGICVEPMNRGALADAFEFMCTNIQDRYLMGEVGRERARQYFRQETMIDTYRKLYREVYGSWQA